MKWLLLVATLTLLSACGDFEWLPKDQAQAQQQNNTNQNLGKYVATDKEKPGDSSFVYHYPDRNCPSAANIHIENRIWFNSEADALATGRTLCGTCRNLQ